MKQVVSISIGEAGTNLGSSIWQRFCQEHHVGFDGRKQNIILNTQDNKYNQEILQTFWNENPKGTYTPRALFFDSDPCTIDQIRKSKLELINRDWLISGKSDAGHNFARGYNCIANQSMQEIMEKVRKITEGCESLQGFMIFRSVGGGTGSGVTSKMLESFSDSYPNLTKVGFSMHPSPFRSNAFIQTYNTIFSTFNQKDHLNADFIFDNEQLYNISQTLAGVQSPTINNLNRLITESVGMVTENMRFQNYNSQKLEQFQTDFVPFPSAHFLVTSYSPYKRPQQKLSVAQITNESFSPQNFQYSIDAIQGRYLAATIMYRGSIVPKDIGAAICSIKTRRTIQFVDWCPTGIKCFLSYRSPPSNLFGQRQVIKDAEALLIANNTGLKSSFLELSHKFGLMYSKKAFVHWFLRQGMQEQFFNDAKDNIDLLLADYRQMELQSAIEDGEQG